MTILTPTSTIVPHGIGGKLPAIATPLLHQRQRRLAARYMNATAGVDGELRKRVLAKYCLGSYDGGTVILAREDRE